VSTRYSAVIESIGRFAGFATLHLTTVWITAPCLFDRVRFNPVFWIIDVSIFGTFGIAYTCDLYIHLDAPRGPHDRTRNIRVYDWFAIRLESSVYAFDPLAEPLLIALHPPAFASFPVKFFLSVL
jgi:hypothetical protein